MWGNNDGQFSSSFMGELYGNAEGVKVEDEDDSYMQDGDEQYDYSDDEVTPASRRGQSQFILPHSSPPPSERSRSRSRSPLGESSSQQSDNFFRLLAPDVIIRYDETGEAADDGEEDDEDEEDLMVDAHSLYDSSEHMDTGYQNDRGRARIGRGRRGGGGGRPRGGRGQRGKRGRGEVEEIPSAVERDFEFAPPPQEIFATDNEIPLELRERVIDYDKKRQLSAMAHARRTMAECENGSESSKSHLDGYFQWSPMSTYERKEEKFEVTRTGSVKSYTTPYAAFRSYWEDDILQMIVDEINRNAPKIRARTFQSEWYPTNTHEILCLFAFWTMLGIIRMPTISSCFSTNYLLKTNIFRNILTFKRYTNLLRSLNYIADYTAFTSASGPQILKPVIDHLNKKFQENYVPSQDIRIDESLTLWKGRLYYRQFMPTKTAKYGIKTFELCESSSGYLWSFLVYTGQHNGSELLQEPTGHKSTAVVKELMGPLLNKGYRLFMDNWFNSPQLARFLKRNHTDCVGMLRYNRHDVPAVVNMAPLNQGQYIARHSGDVCVLAWQDKQQRICMISTCHGSAIGLPSVPSRPPIRPLQFKPQVVLDYDKSMGGIHPKDQVLDPYLIEQRGCTRWYMKLFKRFVNCSILNARILLQSSSQAPVDHLQFRLQLADGLLQNHLMHCPKGRRASAAPTSSHPTRFVNHTHWPVRVPPSPAVAAANRQGRLTCAVCLLNRKYRKTPYKCQTCDVPLCVENCFRIYHTS